VHINQSLKLSLVIPKVHLEEEYHVIQVMYTDYNPSLQPPPLLLHPFKFPSSHLLHLESN
jgi:hypothetical protein